MNGIISRGPLSQLHPWTESHSASNSFTDRYGPCLTRGAAKVNLHDYESSQLAQPVVTSVQGSDVDDLADSVARVQLRDNDWVIGWILAVDPTSVLGSAKYSYGLRASCVIHGYCRPLLIEIPRSRRNGLDDLIGIPLAVLRQEMDCSEENVDQLGMFLRFIVTQLVGVGVRLSRKLRWSHTDRVAFERLDVLLKYTPLLKLFRGYLVSATSRGKCSTHRCNDPEEGTVIAEMGDDEEEVHACELVDLP